MLVTLGEKARLKKQRGKMILVSRRAYLGKVKVVKPEKVRQTYCAKDSRV